MREVSYIIQTKYIPQFEKEGFKFVELPGKNSGVWYPLNSLVLPKGENDLVVLDKNSRSLIKILDKEGVDFIPVDFPQREYPAGKIRIGIKKLRNILIKALFNLNFE